MCNCGKCLCHTCKWTQMCSKVPCIDCWAVIFDCKTDAGKLKPYLIPSLLSGRLSAVKAEWICRLRGYAPPPPIPLQLFKMLRGECHHYIHCYYGSKRRVCFKKLLLWQKTKQVDVWSETFPSSQCQPKQNTLFFLHIVKDNLQILFFPCFKFSRKNCSLCMHL